jgi:hypothetical protein
MMANHCQAEQIASRVRAALPHVKAGTLRFWGEWFGRPYDNIHQIVGCDAQGEVLHIQFNEGEGLYIWSPQRAVFDHRMFRIEDAAHVRWEWFAYGRPKTNQNRFFMDFVKTENRIDSLTNVNWYTPNLRPTVRAPAVEIV